jgi:hypothetical protein
VGPHEAWPRANQWCNLQPLSTFPPGLALLNDAASSVCRTGKVCRSPLTWVDISADRVSVDGADPLMAPSASLVWALHKPRGVVTARTDSRGRQTVFALLETKMAQVAGNPEDSAGGKQQPPPRSSQWRFPIGRLDCDSEGLLLFTNDGRLRPAPPQRLPAPRLAASPLRREAGARACTRTPRRLLTPLPASPRSAKSLRADDAFPIWRPATCA